MRCSGKFRNEIVWFYLVYMAARLIEMYRLLKPAGSIYLHCDPTMSHYLKLLMDAVFGQNNFRNEIVWFYRRWPTKSKSFQRMHDSILYYSKNTNGHHTFNLLFEPSSSRTLSDYKGKRLTTVQTEEGTWVKRQTSGDSEGVPLRDVWEIKRVHTRSHERVGYPTQKPLALLTRIIQASSNDGDMVLDPFAGCATACVAAERHGRQWLGIDISDKAAELVRVRMKRELGLFYQGVHRTDIPKRTDIGKLPKYNSRQNRQKLYGLQAGNCSGCNHHFESRHLEVDHIISRGKGGTDHPDNLQLLCGNCNRVKGDRGMDYLKAKLQIGV